MNLPLLRRRADRDSAGLPPLRPAAEKAVQSVLSGNHSLRRAGMGEKFWQYRDYDPADRPQDIDWRASARSDRIFVREKEKQTPQTILFWCASHPGMDYAGVRGQSTKHETAATLSLALALMAVRGGERVGLLNGAGGAPGHGENLLQDMEKFWRADRAPDALPPLALSFPRHATLVMAGDFWEPAEEIDECLGAWGDRTRGGLMIQVLDPSELDLPFAGRIIFENPRTADERYHILNAAAVRADYRQKIEDHIAALRALCRRHEWSYILHRTDQPLRETLTTAARMMATDDRR